jgi:hypothetical protein
VRLCVAKLYCRVELEKFMSNLLKSKFLLGVMTVAIMFVGVVATHATTAAADCSITTTLRVGSKGAEVQCLQTALGGLTVDGDFGPATKAAVMKFQTNEGLVADGIFGPKSNAAWVANQLTGNFPAGCNSASGFSNTTGAPCNGPAPSNFPLGCSSLVGFSSVTGQSCAFPSIPNLPVGCTSTSGFSPVTGAMCNGSVNLPAGCASNSGFSATTGMPCSGGNVTLPAGCATASGFSPTTGQACTTTTVSNNGTNGFLADLQTDSANRVSEVFESQQDQVVAGVRATARLADQVVDRVRVTFLNTTPGTSSANLTKYISGASLWFGSTKLATIAVTDADRSTSNDVFTFNFSGLHAVIPRETVGHFYVSVNANGSLDSGNSTANWTVTFVGGGISASSPDGSFDTYPANDLIQTGLTFGKFANNGVKATVGLSASSPTAGIITVQNTATTNNVTLLKFTVQATNSDLTLRRIPIQISTTGTAVSVGNVINTLKLMNGTNVIDSVDGSSGAFAVTAASGGTVNQGATCGSSATPKTCGYVFSNLSVPGNLITAGTTQEFTIVADIKQQTGNFAEGDTLLASFTNADAQLATNFSVLDTNGDQLPLGSTFRIGSAVGQIQTLRVNGVSVTMGAATVTTTVDTNGKITSATWAIPMTATAFGQTLYMSQNALAAAPAVSSVTTGAGANSFVFALQNSTAAATDVIPATLTQSLSSSDATVENLAFRLDSGTTKHFTLTVNLSRAPGTPGFFRVHVGQLQTFLDNALSVTPSSQTLLPVEAFESAFQRLD